MITLTRLSGSVFLLNADLIERVDATPDTVITLVDGKKYVVAESMSDVLDAVVAVRGEIYALGSLIATARSHAPTAPTPQREPKLAAVAFHPATTHRDGEQPSRGRRSGGDS